MLPAKRNKVDLSVGLISSAHPPLFLSPTPNGLGRRKLTEEEQKLFRLYGKLPTHKNVLTKMQKVAYAGVPRRVVRLERKYFDSGDYALSKAGKAPQNTVGTAIPSPENIPHATSPPVHQGLSVSPTNSNVNPIPAKESPLAENPKPIEPASEDATAAEESA
ncbi:hypothetical protein ONZ51_g294 [Trametes cubensis]|uniref:mRNA stability protein n=1 Tax=Trametes cubensis TaxID=1111947 RepID=A0AAD7U4Y4_9APHY|nr:hypothetical protein ONZ51_g294 [Trametes cubensis]